MDNIVYTGFNYTMIYVRAVLSLVMRLSIYSDGKYLTGADKTS